MKRAGLVALLGVFCLPVFCSAAGVHVLTRLDGPSSVFVGESTSITVLAGVDQPLSPSDGIFTFDLDFIINNLTGGGQLLAVTNITRPNVNDTLFSGSNGTPTAYGVASIRGGYLQDTLGVGPPTPLFTVTLQGVAPGTVQLTPGPSVDPLGFDFVLYQSTPANTTVTFDQGVRLEVLIPEPGACAMGIGCLLVSLNRRRCRA